MIDAFFYQIEASQTSWCSQATLLEARCGAPKPKKERPVERSFFENSWQWLLPARFFMSFYRKVKNVSIAENHDPKTSLWIAFST